MTKASDNPYPSILIEEASEPAAPASGHQRLYIDSVTHTLHRVDENGDEVDLEAAGSGIAASLFDAKGDLIAASAADTAARLAVGGNGSALIADSGEATGLRWRLNNDGASAAPTVNDDSGNGYSVGSRWLDTTADKEYVCLDASSGAAVWVETTASGGSSDPLGWTTIVASADEDVTNAQNQDHSELQFAVEAGHIYRIEAMFMFSANNAAADAEWRYLVTAGDMDGRGTWQGISTGDTGVVTGVATSGGANSSNVAVGITSTDLGYPVTGLLSIALRQNTSNATFKIQFGNNSVGSGRTTRMLKGSWIRYRDIT